MRSVNKAYVRTKDLRIEEVELPELLPNQILVKLGACGICQSDVECFEGNPRRDVMILRLMPGA